MLFVTLFVFPSCFTSAEPEIFLSLIKILAIVTPALARYFRLWLEMLTYILIPHDEWGSACRVLWSFLEIGKHRHWKIAFPLILGILVSVVDLKPSTFYFDNLVKLAFLAYTHVFTPPSAFKKILHNGFYITIIQDFLIKMWNFLGQKSGHFLHVRAELLSLIRARFVHNSEHRLFYSVLGHIHSLRYLSVADTERGKTGDLALLDGKRF